MSTHTEDRKVIAGPAGHWWAVIEDWQFGQSLVCHPVDAEGGTFDDEHPPPHPADGRLGIVDGWYEPDDQGADDLAEVRRELGLGA